MLLACCPQALTPGDDVSSSSTATAEEVAMVAAAQVELAAWQARMPLAALLTHPAMQRRHILMLLHLMMLSEAGSAACDLAAAAAAEDTTAASEGSPSCSRTVFGGRDSMDAAATVNASEVEGDDAGCDAAAVAAALQHYKLLTCDVYQAQFLRNSAALGVNTSKSQHSDDLLLGDSPGSTTTPPGGFGRSHPQQQQQMGATSPSAAELLVWLSRSGQTAAVLQRMLEVAMGEQQFAQQVTLISCTSLLFIDLE
jgi:hypothetical protein